MVKYQFDELNIVNQRRFKNKHNTLKENTGLDTETYKGKAILLTDSSERYIFIESFDDILQFLTYYYFKSKFNWFFNIRFDFQALIKWLDKDLIEELYNNQHIEYNTYMLSYLDKKLLTIRDKHNHTYQFYDLFNFIQMSLNNASKQYLGKTKLDVVDSFRLNEDKEYWYNNKDNIIKYCIQDSILTKELADYFWLLMQKHLNFLPNKPYSKGSFSQEYFLHHCNIPTINKIPLGVLEYAYNSYSGGRFELLKRGYFDSVYTYDIKSAYPYHMSQLPNYNLGNWRYTEKFIENALSGFYLCNVEFYNDIFSPFMQKIQNLNVYPVGNFQQYLTQNEIEFIISSFDNVSIEVVSGYYFIENAIDYPLQDEIYRLYEWKENETDKEIRYIVKIILNSLYGKFIQCIGGKTGKIFNPLYASEITANTRIQLLKYSLQNPENIIGFSTDAIHSTKPLKFDDTGLLKGLGNFELDYYGKGFFLMSDIYYIENETLEKKYKDKFRGFNITFQDGNIKTIKDIVEQLKDDSIYEYIVKRPTTLSETILHHKKYTVDDLNIWNNIIRRININGDKKRLWEKDFKNGKEVLTEHHNSEPLLIL